MKVAIIGLDCVPPELVFERWGGQLTHLDALRQGGLWGTLRSCDPPITVPAWQVMVTGRDPGELGLYGFRNRSGPAYDAVRIADSHCVSHPRVWDWLGREGLRSLIVGVPLTYPPLPLRGSLVSCFLTPSRGSEYTYPAQLRSRIEARFPDYEFDVGEYRTDDRAALLQRLYRKTAGHFDLAEYLVGAEEWDFFMMVEMGPDRLHHAFWGDDEASERVLFDYYAFLDRRVGELCAALPPDALILVVSDHGAQTMRGGFRINQWLMERGDLVLKEKAQRATPLRPELIDWPRTRVWADGGYAGRLFLNMRGREPQGVVDPRDAETLLVGLQRDLEALHGDDGQAMRNEAFLPRQRFARVEGMAPDLMLYGGELAWRILGGVGYESCFSAENDTGPDGANHHPDGIFILSDRTGTGPVGRTDAIDLLDITPTVLRSFGVPLPSGLRGRPLSLRSGQTREHYVS